MHSVDKSKFNSVLKNYTYLFWGIALSITIHFFYFVISNASIQSHGFASYYTASRLLIEGQSVSRFYDDEWFGSKVNIYVPEVNEIYHANFPTTTLLLVPISALNYKTAKFIWTIFNLLILITTLGFLYAKFEFNRKWLPLILILITSFQPLYANFLFGQAYVFIFCLLAIALYAYKSDRDELLGIAIGAMFVLKSASFVFFILFIAQKKWKSLFYALSTILIVVVITLPWIGINSWFAFSDKFVSYLSHPSLSVTAYQSIHGFFHHLTSADPQWNPEPIFNFPALGKLLSMISILTVLLITFAKAYQSRKSEFVFGAFIAAGLIISPVSLDYHYTLLLLPIFVLLRWMLNNPGEIIRIAIVVFILLVAAYIPYTSAKVTDGWPSLFAYPKLYGTIGLWGIIVFNVKNSSVLETKDQID